MSHDNHVMPHDAIIESRKILKPSKVKEQKEKKKRRRCHLIKGELLKNAQEKETKEPTTSQCNQSVPVAHT
jgi:hypothetical protein